MAAQDPGEIDEDLFVDVLPDYLKCPICLCCLQAPYQTPCGHRFCKACIQPVLKTRNNVCPKDRTVIDNTNTFPDNAVRLQINALRIKCPKHASGCSWIGELSDKAGHERTCEFAEIPCELCGAPFPRVRLASHAGTCPKRKLPCEHCRQQFSFSALSSHYSSCEEYPVVCKNGCAAGKVPRREEEAHYRNECPKEPVDCKMATFGCSERVPRGEMGEHLITCAPQRTLALAETVVELRREVRELSLVVAQQNEQQKNLSKTLYPCCGQFTWKLEDVHSKVQEAQSKNMAEPVMIYSPSFFSHEAGYKMCLCVYPAGDTNQDYLSVYFVLMKGPYDDILPWPFQKSIRISLLSCGEFSRHITKDISPDPALHYFHRPEKVRNVGYGYPKFIALQKLLSDRSEFLAGDAVFIRCEIVQHH